MHARREHGRGMTSAGPKSIQAVLKMIQDGLQRLREVATLPLCNRRLQSTAISPARPPAKLVGICLTRSWLP